MEVDKGVCIMYPIKGGGGGGIPKVIVLPITPPGFACWSRNGGGGGDRREDAVAVVVAVVSVTSSFFLGMMGQLQICDSAYSIPCMIAMINRRALLWHLFPRQKFGGRINNHPSMSPCHFQYPFFYFFISVSKTRICTRIFKYDWHNPLFFIHRRKIRL